MKIIDLSGEYTEKMWYYGEPYTPYSVKDLACVDKNGYIAREYTLTAHTGTHIENSAHWSENAQGISETPIEKFAGNARLLYLPFSESKEITVKRLKAAGAGIAFGTKKNMYLKAHILQYLRQNILYQRE